LNKASKVTNENRTLPLQLCHIEQFGSNLKELAKAENISKQALNWRLNRLLSKDLIQRVQSYPFAIYQLTPYGQRVKEKLIHNENPLESKPIWDIHNFVVRFPIVSYGTISFEGNNNRKITHINNLDYFDEHIGKFIVRINSSKTLLVYCPRRTTENPEQEFIKLGSEAQKIVQEYCNRFDMKLGFMQISRKGHKTLKKSEDIAKLLGKFRTPEIWTDDSEGTGDELEEHQDSKIIESLLEVPNLMKQIVIQQAEFSTNLMTHLEVLKRIGDGIDKFSTELTELTKVVKELKK